MSLHHPPLLTFEESLKAGARLYLRQQDALKHAANEAAIEPVNAEQAIDAYLRRMSETEIRRGPRKPAEPAVAPGQTTVEDALSPVGDSVGTDGVEDPLTA